MSQHQETNPHFKPIQRHRDQQPRQGKRQTQDQHSGPPLPSPGVPPPLGQHEHLDPFSHSPWAIDPKHQRDNQPTPTPPPQPQHRRHGHPQQHGPHLPSERRTRPWIWFSGVFCAILWLVIIISGLIVLIVYLVFRPRSPRFEVSSATLNAAYLDMGYLLNADITILANFTNPNRKVRVDYSYMTIDLYYGNTLIATQYIEPFSAARAESRFANVHMVSSQVRLPIKDVLVMKKQMESNSMAFEVKGLFRARSNLGGFLRYSYWLYGYCSVVMSGPPSGVLLSSKCRTKR